MSVGVVVLGMHRSGTSCLSMLLRENHVPFISTRRKMPASITGTQERRLIVHLNDDVLAHSGGSWDRPPKTIKWTMDHAARRDTIADQISMGRSRFSGWKDPRTLLLLDFWEDGGRRWSYIGTFRHPMASATSLLEYKHIPTEQGLELWLAYNRALLKKHGESSFPIVSFDAKQTDYLRGFQVASNEIGVQIHSMSSFLSRMRHRTAVHSNDLPDEVLHVYDRLKAVSVC